MELSTQDQMLQLLFLQGVKDEIRVLKKRGELPKGYSAYLQNLLQKESQSEHHKRAFNQGESSRYSSKGKEDFETTEFRLNFKKILQKVQLEHYIKQTQLNSSPKAKPSKAPKPYL